ncbi:MAG: sigma 54-interacting transcriptional regulator [Pseudomonadota bacterium]
MSSDYDSTSYAANGGSNDSGAITRQHDEVLGDHAQQQETIFLTVVFHPDLSLIGATTSLQCEAVDRILGRHEPIFSVADVTRELGDPFLSRQALKLRYRGSRLELDRPQGSSGLRVDRESVGGHIQLEPNRLRLGVVLTLAERIVIHLRLAVGVKKTDPAAEDKNSSVLLGVSPAMHALRRAISDAARMPDDVMVSGQTGTGKELVARELHNKSARSRGPWVAVNMAALPVDLAAASLFGARKGSFTGAVADRKGYFQRADGGTLFLDEIGDTPSEVQPQLLRALEAREIQPIGDMPKPISLRVVAATDQDLAQGPNAMRDALRHRLQAQHVTVPALSERLEDVGILAAHYLDEAQAEGAEHWPPEQDDALGLARCCRFFESCASYTWPGNVRELKYAVRQAAWNGGEAWALRGTLLGQEAVDHKVDSEVREPSTDSLDHRKAFAALQEQELHEAWIKADCEVARLARHFAVSRASVYRKIQASSRCRLAADVPLGELLVALDQKQGDLRETACALEISRRGLEARLRASGVDSISSAKTGKADSS